MEFIKKHYKKILIIVGIVIVLGILYSVIINNYVISSTKNRIVEIEELQDIEKIDAIIILGCHVKNNSVPSDLLKDRLDTGFKVYEELNVPIIVSGDHGQKGYDEVNTMKSYLIDLGVPSDSIFMDHAGFSTYDSIYRAKEIFELENVLVITQEYHLYRALYISHNLKINAYGINADIQDHTVRQKDHIREYLARNKDFIKTIFKPKSTYLGETISVSGSGDITND